MRILLISTLSLLCLTPFSIHADLAQEVLNLSGGKQVKVVWLRTDSLVNLNNCYMYKWDTKSPVPKKLIQNKITIYDQLNITPDGNSVIFSDTANGGGLHLANWETGEVTMLKKNGISGKCWKDPLTSKVWVFYRKVQNSRVVSFNKFSLTAPDSDFVVWNQKVQGSDSMDVVYSSFSRDGRYMAAWFPWPYMGLIDMSTMKYIDVSTPSCNLSISPDNSYYTANMLGDHQNLYLKKVDQNGVILTLGTLHLSEAISKKYGGPPEKESYGQWTNDARFIISDGRNYNLPENYNTIRLFKLSKNLDSIEDVVKITDTTGKVGGDGFHTEWAWIEPDQSIPSALYFNPDSGNVSVLEKSFDTDCPDENCVCTVECDKQWATVTVEKNGSKLHIVNRVNPAGLVSGIYNAHTALNFANRKETYDIILTIKGAKQIARLFLNGNKGVIKPGDSCQFVCTAMDQFNEPFETGFTWNVSGGGKIDKNGLFKSSGAEGVFTVSVTSIVDTSKSAVCNIQVVSGVPLPAGDFKELVVLTDENGRRYLPVTDSQYIEHNGILNSRNIYPGARVRAGNKEYVWTTFKNDTTIWFDSSAADNFISYSFLPVISDIDMTVALAMRFQLQVKVWANDSLVNVMSTGDKGTDQYSPFLLKKGNTNVIIRLGALKGANYLRARFVNLNKEDISLKTKSLIEPDNSILHVISPDSGGKFNVGDTITVRWSAVMPRIDGVNVKLSTDRGMTWEDLTSRAILPNNKSWGTFKWVVPNSYEDQSMWSKDCLIRVSCYNLPYFDNSDQPFTLGNPSSAGSLIYKNKGLRVFEDNRFINIQIPEKKTCSVDLYSLNGVVIYRLHNTTGMLRIDKSKLSSGVYFMRISSQSINLNRKINVY